MRDTKDTVFSTTVNHPHRCLLEVEGKEAKRLGGGDAEKDYLIKRFGL